MFLHLTKATYLDDYKIKVEFNNGQEGVADLSVILDRKIFSDLKDKAQFADFKIDAELETIVWKNGMDLAPEYIYYQVFKHDPKRQQQFQDWGYQF